MYVLMVLHGCFIRRSSSKRAGSALDNGEKRVRAFCALLHPKGHPREHGPHAKVLGLEKEGRRKCHSDGG